MNNNNNNNNNTEKNNTNCTTISKTELWKLLRKRDDEIKNDYKFWFTQPVPKLTEEFDDNVNEPYELNNKVEDVRQEPYKLPEGYSWCVCDINNEKERTEIFNLLSDNYVEDNSCMFRFYYSRNFLLWALACPDYIKEWHIGVKETKTDTLIGFITAIPVNVNIKKKIIKMAEVNFLCVHKDLRSKRLAPVLIKEITRRVNLKNIWQALYTAGVYLPKPLSIAKYYHRSLNIKKLIEIGFCSLNSRLTMSRAIKLYKVNNELNLENLRKMEKKDIDNVHKLLNEYLNKYNIHIVYSLDDICHWLLPRDDVIYTYVNEENGIIKDMLSFYSLPSSILGNDKHKILNAAYSYYNIANTTSLKNLINDAITLAKRNNFDVFNILDIMENNPFLDELKFCEGDGTLKYYLYNWKCKTMKPEEIGVVLL